MNRSYSILSGFCPGRTQEVLPYDTTNPSASINQSSSSHLLQLNNLLKPLRCSCLHSLLASTTDRLLDTYSDSRITPGTVHQYIPLTPAIAINAKNVLRHFASEPKPDIVGEKLGCNLQEHVRSQDAASRKEKKRA